MPQIESNRLYGNSSAKGQTRPGAMGWHCCQRHGQWWTPNSQLISHISYVYIFSCPYSYSCHSRTPAEVLQLFYTVGRKSLSLALWGIPAFFLGASCLKQWNCRMLWYLSHPAAIRPWTRRLVLEECSLWMILEVNYLWSYMRLQLTCAYSSRCGFSLGFLTSQFLAKLKYSCAMLCCRRPPFCAFCCEDCPMDDVYRCI